MNHSSTIASPQIARALTLNFIGDWGQANFHRICSWLVQEFCDRAGARSRVAIWNLRDGGLGAMQAVQDGEAQMCICTPVGLVPAALTGKDMFRDRALPDLRALATLPQNDRLVLAIAPEFGVSSFAELRAKKPALSIATSADDGTNFIGFTARRYMEAHGITEEMLTSWGGQYLDTVRPEQSLFLMRDGEADAVLQEAVLAPWWAEVMRKRQAIALPAEDQALTTLEKTYGLGRNSLPAGFWDTLSRDLPTLDFSDFVVLVRNDLPDDVAYLLTWCLCETRQVLEQQYRHLPPDRSPVSYPLVPEKMARTPIPLHPAAARFYREAGHLKG
ncbi:MULTISPECIES: TAXI family TRAP transporter solute-binding subunit [unclassified Beijerinckia]|uniref:TAXI family TRAP transporter solute-binding subunit n=1 Tax=unclassified Beijerinckia TaxID=2638183 RepID=UPI00089D0746|nr:MULTISPECIES: TAXI family TRAP transporter solute-binding subunit [unclassified Beijerinckia]MDH7797725.1 TRAP-type uncharacterized transport system substrate-binding protein [Beijerinckia sp. GAS462]SEC96424.1 hypothetical protein SAMN05443249_4018 [Beijerinckia sp. 28-YEA-48]